ncbi:hypothetical protein R1flu_028777 [Riccia fluitans]|uniref:Uncharacterized protein n=1 Tax=Riccia fluitans TaxID=41844 RepID=A0ABD1XMN9_9MARC
MDSMETTEFELFFYGSTSPCGALCDDFHRFLQKNTYLQISRFKLGRRNSYQKGDSYSTVQLQPDYRETVYSV